MIPWGTGLNEELLVKKLSLHHTKLVGDRFACWLEMQQQAPAEAGGKHTFNCLFGGWSQSGPQERPYVQLHFKVQFVFICFSSWEPKDRRSTSQIFVFSPFCLLAVSMFSGPHGLTCENTAADVGGKYLVVPACFGCSSSSKCSIYRIYLWLCY